MNHERYLRQTIIPGWNQEKLFSSTAIIVGVGAIGSYVSVLLGASGIGKLVLIDFDTIEVSNLNRQLLFRDEDIGKSKVEIAAKRLKEINPELELTYFNNKMEKVPISVYKKADIIIGCLDTFIGRRWINSLAVRLKKPLILGGMFAFLGDVQVIFPYKTPCFECQPLVSERELAQACTPFGDERKKERKEEKEEEPKLPAVATMSAIIGGIMAQETLKILLDIGEPLDNYLFYDGLHNATTIVKLERNPDCPACGDVYKLKKVKFAISEKEKVSDLLVRLALTYGLSNPDILYKGKLLNKDITLKEAGIKNNAVVFVIDKNLAKPISVVLEYV